MAEDLCISKTNAPDCLTLLVAEKVTTVLDSGSNLNLVGSDTCALSLLSMEECCKDSIKTACGEVE